MKSSFHLLRYVDHDSFVHQTNARTKVAAITTMALCLALRPGWVTLSAIWFLGAVTFLSAKLTIGTIPRFPKIVTYGVLLSLILAGINGGEPDFQIGPFSIAVGGVILQTRFILVTFGLLFLSLLLGWTTSPAELPGAVHFLLRPFRALKVPVDEVVAGLALAIRVMPLLMDEMTTTFTLWRSRRKAIRLAEKEALADDGEPASRIVKLRDGLLGAKSDPNEATSEQDGRPARPDPFEEAMVDLVNIAATSASSAVRRAREVGLAMQAKGATKAAVPLTSWGYRDLVAATVTVSIVVLVFTFDF